MTTNKQRMLAKLKAFTMVEMLAVIAVMAIIVALVVPNGIHARTVGEESTVRAQAAALEMGMATYLMQYGAQAKATYANDVGSQVGNAKLDAVVTLLKKHGALPQSVSGPGMAKTFEGYNITIPSQLGGGINVTRNSGAAGASALQIYP